MRIDEQEIKEMISYMKVIIYFIIIGFVSVVSLLGLLIGFLI